MALPTHYALLDNIMLKTRALYAIAQPLTLAGQVRAQRQGRHVSQGYGV